MTTGQILAQCDTIRELSEKATAGPLYAIDVFGPALTDIAAPDVPGEGSPNVVASALWGSEGLTASEAQSMVAMMVEGYTFAPSAAQAIKVAIEALEKIHNAEPNRNWENAAQQARRALQQITEAFEIPLDEQAKH